MRLTADSTAVPCADSRPETGIAVRGQHGGSSMTGSVARSCVLGRQLLRSVLVASALLTLALAAYRLYPLYPHQVGVLLTDAPEVLLDKVPFILSLLPDEFSIIRDFFQ